MTSETDEEDETPQEPEQPLWTKAARGALQTAGAVPFVGGLCSAAAGFWSEREQGRLYEFLKRWLGMLEDEIQEKQKTIAEIAIRLDLHDEEISERVKSEEYQSLVRKAFRNWAGAESQIKRDYIRNILSNSAKSRIASDDVVRVFLDWLHSYSELHFVVIAEVYNSRGITRAEIWRRVGKEIPRDDSAEADLFKLLFHDLTVGYVIRQHREVDQHGRFIKKRAGGKKSSADQHMKSAFDDEKFYELTALGRQFVHYAMTEVPAKLAYHPDASE